MNHALNRQLARGNRVHQPLARLSERAHRVVAVQPSATHRALEARANPVAVGPLLIVDKRLHPVVYTRSTGEVAASAHDHKHDVACAVDHGCSCYRVCVCLRVCVFLNLFACVFFQFLNRSENVLMKQNVVCSDM